MSKLISTILQGEGATTILILTSLLSIFWLLCKLTSKDPHNPPLPPGPRPLPLVGNLLSLDQELHSYFASIAKTYGPISRVWFGKKLGILITSPELAREVLKQNDIIFANRDVPVAGLEATYGGNDIVWQPYGDQWRMLRKIIVREMLSNHALDSVYSVRRKEVRNTVNYLYKHAAGSPVNIGEQMFLTMFNVITGMMWGGTVKSEDRERVGAEFRRLVAELNGYLGMPNLSDFYPGLARFDLQGVRKNMRVLAKRFDGIFDPLIDQRRKMGSDGDKDFLEFLLQLTNRGDSNPPFTIAHLKGLLMDMVVGGTDTASNTVEFALAELMSHPEILIKAQQELDTVVGKESVVEESHINKLPYLYAIMKETLRLHTAIPLLIPHCPGESCVIGGYTIPKGARVFVNAWAIHRDPTIWENPLEFRPERFLDGRWDHTGKDFSYLPFGSGRRICVGTAMAEQMFMVLLGSIIHSFDWKLAEGKQHDLSEKFGMVLKKKVALVAIPTPRLLDPTLYE